MVGYPLRETEIVVGDAQPAISRTSKDLSAVGGNVDLRACAIDFFREDTLTIQPRNFRKLLKSRRKNCREGRTFGHKRAVGTMRIIHFVFLTGAFRHKNFYRKTKTGT